MSAKTIAQARIVVEAAEKRIFELQAKLEMEQAKAKLEREEDPK